MVVKPLLLAVVIPASVTAVLGGIAVRLPRPVEQDDRRRDGLRAMLLALSVTAGYFFANAATVGWSLTEEWARLPYLMLGGAVVGGCVGRRRVPRGAGVALTLLWAGAAAVLLVPAFPDVAANMTAWRCGVGGLVALTTLSSVVALRGGDARAGGTTTGAARWGGLAPGALWVMNVGAAAVLLLMAGHATLAQLAGGLAATLTAAVFVSMLLRGTSAMVGLAPVASVGLLGLLASGWFNNYSDVPFDAFVIVGVTPLVILLRRWPALSRRPPWQLAAAQLTLALIPIGWSLTRALTVFLRESAADAYYAA